MKTIKYLYSLIALFAFTGNINAQEAQLIINEFEIQAGQKVNMEVELQNPDNISSLQFYVVLPTGISLAGKPTFNEERRGSDVDEFGDPVAAGTAISYNNDNGTVKILICDTQENIPFKGNSGKICTIPVKAAEDIASGDHTITVTGIVLAYVNGNTIELADMTTKATVPAPNVDATSVSLDNTTLTLTVGETSTLVATIAPDNATDKTLTWTTSNAEVATVADGVVTAVAAGTAVITVATANGLTATCEVTVKNPVVEVTGITLNKTELTLYLENGTKSETLVATVAPENATDKTVTWTTSDESIATVTSEGAVTAVGVGTATITATTSNGLTATCAITVEADAAVESITIDGLKNISVYNVAGQYVGNNTEALNKGVYIVNGKKVVIR